MIDIAGRSGRVPRRMGLRCLVCLTLLVVVPLAGCAGKSKRSASAGPDSARAESAAAANRLPPRTETRVDSISLDGMEQSVRVRLYDSRLAGLDVPFTTYVPEDMAVRSAPRETGDRFVARAVFGGQVEPRAFVEARILPPGATREAALDSLARWAPDVRASPLENDKRYPWSLAERWTDRGSGAGAVEGVAALGRHGKRYFVIRIEYPPEYGEGLLPRVELVLEEWRWEDTGEGLGS